MGAIEIREATRSDVQPALTVLRRSGLGRDLDVEVADLPHTVGGEDDPLNRGVVLVAMNNAVVTGVSWARNRFSRNGRHNELVWCWETLAVRDDHRGRGFGLALATATLERARQAGVELIYGVCSPALVPFHEKNGMTSTPLHRSLIVTTPSPLISPLTVGEGNCFVYRLLPDNPSVQVDVVEATRSTIERLLGQRAEPRH
ncbi:MAG: hypothetical protein JWM34_3304 [Ilumatobacteraceae bacterium]|nr:hypothetical protein [Ilumatobacteraceae bacterium]